MTRFRNIRDNSIRDQTRPGNIGDPPDPFEQVFSLREQAETFQSSVEGIGRALSQDDLDIHDAVTIALDALTIVDSVIPGLDIPVVDFERSEVENFDELTPLNSLDNVAAGILPSLDSDPFDCDRWAAGPFCQYGQFFRGLDFGAGLVVSFTDCETCIRASVTAFGVELPLFMVCYRRDECRPTPPAPAPAPAPTPAPEPEPGSLRTFNCIAPPQEEPYVFWVAGTLQTEGRKEYSAPVNQGGFLTGSTSQISARGGLGLFIPVEEWEDPIRYIRSQGWTLAQRRASNTWTSEERTFQNSISVTKFDFYSETEYQGFRFGVPESAVFDFAYSRWKGMVLYRIQVFDITHISTVIENHRFSEARPTGSTRYVSRYNALSRPRFTYSNYSPEACIVGPVSPPPQVVTDPPITPPRRCPVTCCPDTQERLDFIIYRLGLQNLPVEMEDSITDPEDTTRPVDNMVEMNYLFIKYFMEIAGEFPIKLNVITDEGEESGEREIPNMSLYFAEVYALLFSIGRDSDASWAGSISTLGLLAQVEAMLVNIQSLVEANSEFMGYRLNNIERDIQLPFNPQGNPSTDSQSDFFTPTTMKALAFESQEKFTLYAFMERANYILGVLQHTVMETGTPDYLDSVLVDIGQRILNSQSPEEQETSRSKTRDRLEKLEQQLNQYRRANNMPEITISLKTTQP